MTEDHRRVKKHNDLGYFHAARYVLQKSHKMMQFWIYNQFLKRWDSQIYKDITISRSDTYFPNHMLIKTTHTKLCTTFVNKPDQKELLYKQRLTADGGLGQREEEPGGSVVLGLLVNVQSVWEGKLCLQMSSVMFHPVLLCLCCSSREWEVSSRSHTL